jgi:hypothetical protein
MACLADKVEDYVLTLVCIMFRHSKVFWMFHLEMSVMFLILV